MRLRRNEYCPIHKSFFCCGRESAPNRPRLVRLGVQRVDDPHHARGYRELRSAAEMRKLLNRKVVEQDRKCAIRLLPATVSVIHDAIIFTERIMQEIDNLCSR
jgi:hypothetical protein